MTYVKRKTILSNVCFILFTFALILSRPIQGLSILGATNTVAPSSEFYVTDKSNVINSYVKEHIITINHQFEKTSEKPQVAIVTIPTLDGVDIETFAVEQFERMALGNKQYDNGILILLATEDREIRVEVGYGLEGALNDAKVGRIIDASIYELSQGDYSLALQDIFNQIVLQIQQEYGYDDLLNGQVSMIESEGGSDAVDIMMLVGGLVLFVIIAKVLGLDIFEILYLLAAFSNSSGGGNSSSHRSSGGGGRSGGGGASRKF